VRDCALVLRALAGHDPRDSTSVDVPVPDYVMALSGEIKGMRLGVPREYFVAGMEPGVEAAVRDAIRVLEGLGAEVVEVSLPSTERGLATYYIIAPAEASANLARYDGVKYGLTAGEAFFATGTDTGGSIRQPASLSGVVGLKPTYGRVSRYGMIAFASSLDQCGPLTRSVRDAALVLGALAGIDPRDSTSVDLPVPDYTSALTGDLAGLRLGVPREYFVEGMEPGVERAVREAIALLEALGAEIVEVSLPSTAAGLATYYIIAPAEASANLARFDGIRYGYSAGHDDLLEHYLRTRGEGFGPEVKRRIMLGTYALSAGYYDAYYVKAQQVRTLIKAEFDSVLAEVDALLAPTSPSVAFPIGAKTDDPLLMYLNDACTLPVNIAGLPGISVPCGLSDGKPVGLQVIGRAFDEAMVLRVADAYERAAGFADLRSPLAAVHG
jgi:aspartyl-tRNA(Asn)/glutamyl-tRNA(Gln) amidotransferase subunit A